MSAHVESGPNHGKFINDAPLIITIVNLITLVSQLLLGGISLAAIAFANLITNPISVKQHIYLCVLGYVILMAQSVHTISVNTSWARALRYEDRRLIHAIMQILGSILAIAGGITRIADVGYLNWNTHGIFGFLAMILTTISLIGGMASFYSARMNFNPNLGKAFHSIAGCLTLCFAFIALIIGFHDYYRIFLGDSNANMMIACSVIGLLGTLMAPSINVIIRLSRV